MFSLTKSFWMNLNNRLRSELWDLLEYPETSKVSCQHCILQKCKESMAYFCSLPTGGSDPLIHFHELCVRVHTDPCYGGGTTHPSINIIGIYKSFHFLLHPQAILESDSSLRNSYAQDNELVEHNSWYGNKIFLCLSVPLKIIQDRR